MCWTSCGAVLVQGSPPSFTEIPPALSPSTRGPPPRVCSGGNGEGTAKIRRLSTGSWLSMVPRLTLRQAICQAETWLHRILWAAGHWSLPHVHLLRPLLMEDSSRNISEATSAKARKLCQWPNCQETELGESHDHSSLISKATSLISKDLTQEGRLHATSGARFSI